MNEKILDKVRKLRALSESANVHEAAAAAAAAERLIQEHNLSEAALEIESEEEGITSEGLVDTGSTIPTWRANLIAHLSRAYQCSGFYDRVRDTIRGTQSFQYKAYGRPSDIATLRYQDAFFSTEIARLTARLAKGRGRTWANSFRLGAVAAIADSIAIVTKSVRAQSTSTALAVVDQRADDAKRQRDVENPRLRNGGGGGSRLDGDAYAAGKRAGAGISQRTQLGVSSGSRLLGSGS